MATPSLVYQDSPGGLPATFTLPPGFDLELAQVHATFDGGGASGTFYPCLAIYSQDNKLLGRYFPSQTLATGDDGGVTFAPFLDGAAGGGVSGTGGKSLGPYVDLIVSGGSQLIPSGSTENIVWEAVNYRGALDPSVWDQDGQIWDSSNSPNGPDSSWYTPAPTVSPGYVAWLMTATVYWEDPSAACILQVDVGGARQSLNYDGVTSLSGIVLATCATQVEDAYGTSVSFLVQVRQNSGVDLYVTNAYAQIALIGLD